MNSRNEILVINISKESLIAELEKRIAIIIDDRISASLGKSKPSAQKENYITRKEAAQILGISLVTLDAWSYKKSLLKAYRISSRVRYKRSEVEACLLQIKTWKHSRQNEERGGYG